MIFEHLQKLADLRPRGFIELGESFSGVPNFTGDHRPAVLLQPHRDRMDRGPLGDKPRAITALRDIIVLRVRSGLKIIRPRFNGHPFKVDTAIGMVRLH